MPIVRNKGAVAGKDWHTGFDFEKGGAFWVRAERSKHDCLSSSGFATCVGLVLYGDVEGRGAVAHFWHPAGLEEAKSIVDDYMEWLKKMTGGYCGDDVEAVVFGGTSIDSPVGEDKTKPRIDAIAGWLENRWDMRVLRVTKGSAAVKLDLRGDGPIENHVSFDFGLLSTHLHLSTQSALSKANSSGALTKAPTQVRSNRSGSL